MPLNPDQMAIFNDVCEAIVCGASSDSAAQTAGISQRTVFLWLAKNLDIRPAYAAACALRGLFLAEEVVRVIHLLADGTKKTNEEISALRERAALARWYASCTQPKVYGDKVQIDDGKSEVKQPFSNDEILNKIKEHLDERGMMVVPKPVETPSTGDKPS